MSNLLNIMIPRVIENSLCFLLTICKQHNLNNFGECFAQLFFFIFKSSWYRKGFCIFYLVLCSYLVFNFLNFPHLFLSMVYGFILYLIWSSMKSSICCSAIFTAIQSFHFGKNFLLKKNKSFLKQNILRGCENFHSFGNLIRLR